MKWLLILILSLGTPAVLAEESATQQLDNTVTAVPLQTPTVQPTMTQTLAALKEQFTLGFFTVPGCHYCQQQKQTLRQFYQRYGWQIKEIDTIVHAELAKKFHVDVTPTLVIIKSNASGWLPISVGVEPLSTIEQSVFRAIQLFSKNTATQDNNNISNLLMGAAS